jgi:hypothetical protein
LASPHCGSADDYLYVALLVISVQLIVTIKADRHRYVLGWQLAPVTGAAVYERKLFFAEFLFGAASDLKGMVVSMTAGGWCFGNPSLSGEFRPFCPMWACVSVVGSGVSRP